MPTLTITKTYEDGSVLFESDLGLFILAVETLINTNGVDYVNIAEAGLTFSNLNTNCFETGVFTTAASAYTLASKALSSSSLSKNAGLYHGITGACRYFDTFNGTLSVPRGWMSCNGQVINETNYDAIHGAGAYAADGIASSAILGKYLPLSGNYVRGITDTASTANGASTGSYEGTSTSTTVQDHGHNWMIPGSGGVHGKYYNSTGTATSFPAGVTGTSSARHLRLAEDDPFNQSTDTVVTDVPKDTETLSVNPVAHALLLIMKVG